MSCSSPTYYTGTHRENARLVGPGRALDPDRWFVVVPNMFGNGVSSSPSNHGSQGGADFPRVSLAADEMRARGSGIPVLEPNLAGREHDLRSTVCQGIGTELVISQPFEG